MLAIPRNIPNLLVAGLLLAVLAVSLWPHIERQFVYFPTSEILDTPDQLGLEYEDVFIPVSDGERINGWFVPGPSEVTLLWLHGNGGNIGHRLDELGLMHYRLGVNILIVDYRGYGRSDGRPSEAGLYQDAQAALAYLQTREDVNSDKIVYFGRSLGAAVAVELATQQPPYGLVLVAPFASLGHMARLALPWLPLHWLVRNHFNSLERIRGLHAPLLVIHGEQDQTVPISQGQLLYEAANSPKVFQNLPAAAHNDTYDQGGETYWQSWSDFLESLEGGESP
ncbi:MAG: alpha/beta hydrolase [Dehalococcoidia bacterium]